MVELAGKAKICVVTSGLGVLGTTGDASREIRGDGAMITSK